MKLTKHAGKRVQQRGFSKQIIDIILDKGRQQFALGGATKVFLGRKESQAVITELKRAIQIMDKAKNSTLIITDDLILTVY